MFNEAGKEVVSEGESFYRHILRWCKCPQGQADYQAYETKRKKEEWLLEARQIVLPLEIGKYADFRFATWDKDRQPPNSQDVFQSVNTYAKNVSSGNTARWLYLHGDYGLGKTHLAVAATRYIAAQRLIKPLVVVWPEHCSKVQESWDLRPGESGETEHHLWSRMRAAGVLLLDDIDKIAPSKWAIQKLYEVIEHRYTRNRTTIVTANHSISALRGVWQRSKQDHIRDTGAALLSRVEGQLYGLFEFVGKDQRRM